MPLETGAVYISDLVPSNPQGDIDPKSEGDDHLRIIKSTIKTTFPSITGPVTANHTELSACKGMSGSADTYLIIPGAIVPEYVAATYTVSDQNGQLKSWRNAVTKTLTGSVISFTGIPTDAKMIRFVWKGVILNFDDNFIMTSGDLSDFEGITYRYGIVAESHAALGWATNYVAITYDQDNSPSTQTGMMTMVRLNPTTWVIESRSSETLNTTMGQIHEATGHATGAAVGGLSFETAGAATFSAGTITMYVYN